MLEEIRTFFLFVSRDKNSRINRHEIERLFFISLKIGDCNIGAVRLVRKPAGFHCARLVFTVHSLTNSSRFIQISLNSSQPDFTVLDKNTVHSLTNSSRFVPANRARKGLIVDDCATCPCRSTWPVLLARIVAMARQTIIYALYQKGRKRSLNICM